MLEHATRKSDCKLSVEARRCIVTTKSVVLDTACGIMQVRHHVAAAQNDLKVARAVGGPVVSRMHEEYETATAPIVAGPVVVAAVAEATGRVTRARGVAAAAASSARVPQGGSCPS